MNTVKELSQSRVLELVASNATDTLIVESLYLVKGIASSAMKKMGVFSLSRDDYEDLLATIQLAIVECAHKYDPDRYSGVEWVRYITIMARYSGMVFLARQSKYEQRVISVVHSEDDEDEDIYNTLSRDGDMVQVRALILSTLADRDLTDEEKTIVNALYYEEKTIKETAHELHRSVDYVSVTRSRALIKLRNRVA